MPIKIIASDLDGTLMYTDHVTVTKRTYQALKQTHDMGVKLAISTGRPLALLDGVLEQIPFVDYVITANGAGVYDRNSGRNIYTNYISNDIAVKMIKYFLTQEVFFDVYIDGRSKYQLGYEKYFINEDFETPFMKEIMLSMDGFDNLLDYVENKDIEKITLYNVKDKDYDIFKAEMENYGLNTATSFKGNLEATVGTTDKGYALKGLCDILGFTADEAMTFGDAGNDCPMLEFAKYSFAMKNATPQCKASAKYSAKSNAEDGVAQAIEEFVLKKVK
ncbi:MAG: Cof-type HAD-IIB family hydrolase [Acetobacter sp.]|nr:Cof-type HAD-IIB family hydrolase [Bacteroides sp.]MCM1341970.1 Cof-type HAD-IIB family hydrolase [Acetobacter sp.]MCM1434155.1 Cof-type HAD-IIB family hydrolase [Clostridiales bacterium]